MNKSLKCYALRGWLFLSILLSTPLGFAHNIAIGRYLAITETPQRSQAQLLQQQIHIQFPHNLLTLQQAVTFMLQFSGYHLVKTQSLKPPAHALLDQPIPEVDRTLGPMTLEQGLTTLVGRPFYVLIDPIHRLIGFKVKNRYQHLVSP